jgi:type I restriction-modification system DNA methylase subunit
MPGMPHGRAKRPNECKNSHFGFEVIHWATAEKSHGNPTTRRLARMNLAIRSIEGNLGLEPADSSHRDRHKGPKADYILANPPFNMSDWG